MIHKDDGTVRIHHTTLWWLLMAAEAYQETAVGGGDSLEESVRLRVKSAIGHGEEILREASPGYAALLERFDVDYPEEIL